MEDLKAAVKKVRENKQTIELDFGFVCWSIRLQKVVIVPKD